MSAPLVTDPLVAPALPGLGPEPPTPYANVGFQIMKPQILDGHGPGGFSVVPIWRELAAKGRLYGAVMDGFWMHVGDPAAREAAEARLT